MYIPKSAGEAKPFTIPLSAVREMLYGRYTDIGRKAIQGWSQFMNVLGSIHVPENYYENDPHIIANLDEADPSIIGRVGTIWVSPNFADTIREVYAVSMMRSIPTLPVATFWANVEPYWVPKEVQYPTRALTTTLYWSTERPLDDLLWLTPDVHRVIVATAYPDLMGDQVLIDYADTEAEVAVSTISAVCTQQQQECALAIGDSSSGATFTAIVSSVLRINSFAQACVEECVAKGLTGVELGWQPQLLSQVAQYDQLVDALSTALTAQGLTLGLNVEGRPAVPYSGSTLDTVSWINLLLYGFGNPDSTLADVSEELAAMWLQMVADPSKISLGMSCVGQDYRTGQPVPIAYSEILNQFGLATSLTDVAGGVPPLAITYNGIPQVVAKTGLARTLGLGGIAFTAPEADVQDEQSLILAGMRSALDGSIGATDTITTLAYAKGWSIVSGPCNWNNPDEVAVMLIDQTVPYADGGRAFVDMTLATLGATA